MEVGYTLTFHPEVIKYDIPRLDAPVRRIARDTIRAKLCSHPEIYGAPLTGDLKGCWKLRIGNYRAVFRIRGRTVHIYAVMHRSIVYREAQKRL